MNTEWLNVIRLRCRALLYRRRLERDLEDELAFHLALRAARHGQSAADARRHFGNPTHWKETCRDMWTFYWFETLRQDLRYALRTLLKSPGFTIVAALTLALGIGANTAIFSVVSAVMLRPLPYPDSSRLVELWGNVKRVKVERRGASYPDYSDWRDQSRSFEAMAAVDTGNFNLTGVNEPERLLGEFVSQPYFSLLGVQPSLGRAFLPEEDQVARRDAVVILSGGLWRRRFGADPAIIGRSLILNARSYSIIGVMPTWFRGIGDHADLWVPFMMNGSAQDLAERGSRGFFALARLRPDVALPRAQAEMDAISKRLERAWPATNEGRAVELSPLATEIFGDMRAPLLVLLAAVGFVLLIACTNVANLVLARSEARQREMALRIALGAARSRILHQLMTESFVLAALGAGLGILLARWGVSVLMAASPVTFPSYIHPSLDLRVAAFTVLLTCFAALVLGLAPAVQVRGGNLHEVFKQASSHAADSRGGSRFRGVLVVSEIALAMLLLIGAGLLIRSLHELSVIRPGYDPDHVLALQVSLPRLAPPSATVSAQAPVDARSVVSARDLLERVLQVPSVETAALGSDVPLSDSSAVFYTAEDQPPMTAQNAPRAYVHTASPGFFHALRIRLVAGRTFAENETQDSNVVIVSESLVRRFWPGQDPIGKRIRPGRASSQSPWMNIIGVVNEMKYRGLPNNPTADPDIFLPLSERRRTFALLVRTPLDPASLATSIRAIVHNLEPSAVLFDVETIQTVLARATAPSRFTGWLMAVFAGAALLLAMIGIYGVMSYAVSRRTQEIGIRVALGAARPDILRLIVGGGMRLIAAGLGCGVAAALALTRVLGTLLYGVGATDLATFAAAAVLLGSVAIVACLLPAARAGRIAPALALRNE